MSELNYSKKQIQPLIDKYAINPEKNTTFQRIIKMFDGQPNYQLWGVKVVFSKSVKVEELENIKGWADINSNLIKLLTKNGNLVSYTTSADFTQLRMEMDGLCKIAFVKNVISRFNTDQRKLLSEHIKPDTFNGLSCGKNRTFCEWFDLFNKFNKLSANTKTKVIGRMSAVRNMDEIKRLLNESLKEKYNWNKEDLIAFVANNAPDTEVIFDNGDIVILKVNSYKDSNILCFGRTSWCITSSENQWKSYAGQSGRKQFFLFDFAKPEKDELAHIGFTTSGKEGIYAAHSTSDQSLMNSGISYHGKMVNIQKALSDAGVGLSAFMELKPNLRYKWDEKAVEEFVNKNSKCLAIAYHKDKRIIVNVLTNDGLKMLCDNTYVKTGNMPVDSNSKCYVLFDFNCELTNEKSMVAIYYKKDSYKIDTLNQMWGVYGTNLKDAKYLSTIGIETDDYLNREKVDCNILLHKLIDEGDEEGALKLIDKEKDINVNFEFNDRRPIFSAIEKKMHKVVGKIMLNDKFDSNADDGFGESLPQNLLFAYYLNEACTMSSKELESVNKMVEMIVDSGKFDLNYVDSNEDTLINIACMNSNMLWLVKKLAARKDINVNHVNDALPGYAALGNALRRNNIEAVKILGKRPDLEVRKEDKELAKKMGIKLADFIKPEPFNEVTEATVGTTVTAEVSDAEHYNEIFKKVFSL